MSLAFSEPTNWRGIPGGFGARFSGLDSKMCCLLPLSSEEDDLQALGLEVGGC